MIIYFPLRACRPNRGSFRGETPTRVYGNGNPHPARVFTDPRPSATGYPFKVLELEHTVRQNDSRERICDLGYRRTAYEGADGRIGYRCAAEPVEQYVAKGGAERPLLTSGDDLETVRRLVGARTGYTAQDVVEFLLGGVTAV